ncbi:MAG: PspA/IM30 family protein [Candidatus Poribacteria bacterium]|nr:PspA/IM30 family protein [Candidatus Poribacteria bacterium]
MQTLNRAKLIIRSHVSDLLTKAEDTRKTRGLMLEEMRQNIRNVKSLIAGAITDLKLLEREIDEHGREAQRWEEKAVFALKKGEEELARRALARKCEHIKRADQYREQTATQQETIDSLKSSLKTLETQLDSMRYRTAKFVVTESVESSRPAVSSSPPADVVIDTSTFDAYDRMIERVRDLEAHAEALAELTQGDDLEQKFHELERKETVEADLAALKAKVAAEDSESSTSTG